MTTKPQTKMIENDPERANATEDPKTLPLPGVGETVIFYPRPGELRPGRGKHAAIVTASNEEDDTLDLVVIFDYDDFVGQRRVKRRDLDGGMGWEPRPRFAPFVNIPPHDTDTIARLYEELAKTNEKVAGIFQALFGSYEVPNEPLLEVIDNHEERLQKLEPNVSAAKKPEAKPKPAKGKPKPKGK